MRRAQEACAICLQPINPCAPRTCPICTTPLHPACLRAWLERKPEAGCPGCRSVLAPPSDSAPARRAARGPTGPEDDVDRLPARRRAARLAAIGCYVLLYGLGAVCMAGLDGSGRARAMFRSPLALLIFPCVGMALAACAFAVFLCACTALESALAARGRRGRRPI